MSKTKQIDLEDYISKVPNELIDPFTGEVFKPTARNHYEHNDGVPVAPSAEFTRPTIRQRIENLLNRDPDILRRYMTEGPPDGSEGVDMEVPDDPEAPLTPSEGNYLDSIAAELSEQAPLPDDGLPRREASKPPEVPQTAPAAPGGGPGAVSTPAVAPAVTVPTR